MSRTGTGRRPTENELQPPVIGSCLTCERALVALRDWAPLRPRVRKALQPTHAVNGGLSLCTKCKPVRAEMERKVRGIR